jgi:hypothetical protein
MAWVIEFRGQPENPECKYYNTWTPLWEGGNIKFTCKLIAKKHFQYPLDWEYRLVEV